MRLPLLVLLLLLPLSACSPAYVLRAGWEEAKILGARKPITKLIADADFPADQRAKLELVLEARRFAAEELDLDAGKSYTTFARVKSDTLALVLSAARKDTFAAYTWWFPIVGHVPYKGFFSEAKARKAMAKLERKGFDTYLRPTAAFSTLGWFNDPMLSTLLRYDSVALANTVVHELLHNTVYVAGEAMFNESFANFAGARGSIAFFCGREGAASDRCRRAQATWRDELLFGSFLSALVAELEAVYARQDLTRAEKLAVRETVFQRAQIEFATRVRPRFEVATFATFTRDPLNNATLISRRLYYHELDLFERVFQRTGGDLRQAISLIVSAAQGADDPYAATAALLSP